MEKINMTAPSRGGGLQSSSPIVSINFIDKILDAMRLLETGEQDG